MTDETTAFRVPAGASDNSEALTFLVTQGVTREAAIDLLNESGPPLSRESLPEWADRVLGRSPTKAERRRLLDEHHEQGLPPPEPPALSGS